MRARPLVAALLVALAALAWSPDAAGAQDVTDVRLVVTHLTGIVGAGAPAPEGAEPPTDVSLRLVVENRGTTDLDGLRVVVETWGRVDTRSEMRAALAGGDVPAPANSPLDASVRDGGSLAAGETAGLAFTIEADRLDLHAEDGPTAHPVQISVVRGTRVLDQVRTAVVHLPSAPTAPLETVLVWPIDDAPWRGPNGEYLADVDAPIRPGGRLDRMLRAIEQHPDIPVTLAPAAHLLEDLRDRADGFTAVTLAGGASDLAPVGPEDPAAVAANDYLRRIREVATSAQLPPVAGPYADVTLSGMTSRSATLNELAGTAVADGRERLRALLDRRPDQGTFLATSPLDEAALDLLPGDLVIVPYAGVQGPDLEANANVDIPYPYRRTTTPAGRTMRFLVADPWVTTLLGTADTSHGPVLAAHRVVVETAMLQLQRPGVDGRPLVVLPPLDWAPDGRTAEEVLTQLAAAPWLRLADAASLPTRADREPLAVTFPQTDVPAVAAIEAELVAADQALEAATAALPEDGARIDGRPRSALEQQVLRAPSTWYLSGRVDRSGALLRDVLAAVDRSFGEVEVPASARVTLTSERGTIPVTLRREGGPLTVRVTVDSPGGLAWPEGRTSPPVTLTEDGTQTVSFQTRALSRGTFAVTVTVTDPTGTRVLDTARLSVRSTAISGPALGITGLIVALLLLRGLLRRRPPDRPKLEVVR